MTRRAPKRFCDAVKELDEFDLDRLAKKVRLPPRVSTATHHHVLTRAQSTEDYNYLKSSGFDTKDQAVEAILNK